MSSIRKWMAAGAILASAAALAGVYTASAPGAAAAAKCPSAGVPAPGSTVYGGLEVDGRCRLVNVTVTGGIYVDPSPDSAILELNWNRLFLIGSKVFGGLVVGEGSVARVNNAPPDFNLTPDPTTIDGGITLNQPFFADIGNAVVRGGLTVNGIKSQDILCGGEEFCNGSISLCASTVYGNVLERDVDFGQAFIGDPREDFYANADCGGNTIHGSVLMEHSNFIRFPDGEPSEIEGNTVDGSVLLDDSVAEVNENTIGGSLLCKNGSELHPPPAPDIAGNTVRGNDTCD